MTKSSSSSTKSGRPEAGRNWAGLLLLLMAVIMIGGSLPGLHHILGNPLWLSMVQEGARAGVVGGLADWFAVTALFRHPFGIPIPHTAILPKRQRQLGEALGQFVAGHFFGDDDIIRLLARFNLAGKLVTTLEKPEISGTIVGIMRSFIPGLFERLNDGRGSHFLSQIVPLLLQGEAANALLVRAMRAMVEGEVHQEVFSFFLGQLKALVILREPELRQFVEQRVREQGGRVVGWAIGGAVASQVLGSLKMELERIDPMDSSLRQGFSNWVRGKIDQMEQNPAEMDSMIAAIAEFFAHNSLREWGGSLWQRLSDIAERDGEKEDGWGAQASENLLKYFLVIIRGQGIWKERIDETATRVILYLMPAVRGEISGLIARIMDSWDGVQFSARLERGVGRDLVFIRINGTLVGFFVGAGLELLLHFLASMPGWGGL